MECDAIIIGVRPTGLTCGAYLAKQALRVIVAERRDPFEHSWKIAGT